MMYACLVKYLDLDIGLWFDFGRGQLTVIPTWLAMQWVESHAKFILISAGLDFPLYI